MDIKQKLLDFQSKTNTSKDGTTKTLSQLSYWKFDQELCRKALARMLIMDELPFIYVKRESFRYFGKALNPGFLPPSRPTVTRDCYLLYIDERNKLLDFFGTMTSRVCLTTDTWTSCQNLSYMCLTAHFIDDNWTLHKRIINFYPITDHNG